jgi:hypothetical protein
MTLPGYAMNQASFPEMYEWWLVGPLFRPWAEMTLEEVALSPGDRVLDRRQSGDRQRLTRASSPAA